MARIMTRTASIVLLALLLLPGETAVARDKGAPSSREIKQMIKFGISLGEQGLWKEALYRWQEALRYDPDNPQLHNNIAVALESQGDLEGARESYRRAEELAGRARYIDRNIADFEELFAALELYEEQYRTPPAGDPESEDTAGDGDAESLTAPAENQTAEEDMAGNDTEPSAPPETEAAPSAGEEEPESEPPAGDEPGEETE